MRTRTLVAANVASFQYVADGDTMYVLTLDAGLWRQEGKDKPVAVDTSVASFQAVDMHLTYVLSGTAACGRSSAVASMRCWWTTVCSSHPESHHSRRWINIMSTYSAMIAVGGDHAAWAVALLPISNCNRSASPCFAILLMQGGKFHAR